MALPHRPSPPHPCCPRLPVHLALPPQPCTNPVSPGEWPFTPGHPRALITHLILGALVGSVSQQNLDGKRVSLYACQDEGRGATLRSSKATQTSEKAICHNMCRPAHDLPLYTQTLPSNAMSQARCFALLGNHSRRLDHHSPNQSPFAASIAIYSINHHLPCCPLPLCWLRQPKAPQELGCRKNQG